MGIVPHDGPAPAVRREVVLGGGPAALPTDVDALLSVHLTDGTLKEDGMGADSQEQAAEHDRQRMAAELVNCKLMLAERDRLIAAHIARYDACERRLNELGAVNFDQLRGRLMRTEKELARMTKLRNEWHEAATSELSRKDRKRLLKEPRCSECRERVLVTICHGCARRMYSQSVLVDIARGKAKQ